jgi:hypothetical protein
MKSLLLTIAWLSVHATNTPIDREDFLAIMFNAQRFFKGTLGYTKRAHFILTETVADPPKEVAETIRELIPRMSAIGFDSLAERFRTSGTLLRKKEGDHISSFPDLLEMTETVAQCMQSIVESFPKTPVVQWQILMRDIFADIASDWKSNVSEMKSLKPQ